MKQNSFCTLFLLLLCAITFALSAAEISLAPPSISNDFSATVKYYVDEDETRLVNYFVDWTAQRSLEVVQTSGTTNDTAQYLTILNDTPFFDTRVSFDQRTCTYLCGCPCTPPPAPCAGCDAVLVNLWQVLPNTTFAGECPSDTRGYLWNTTIDASTPEQLSYCIDKQNPIPYSISLNGTLLAAFLKFQPGRPDATLFTVPSYCRCS